MPIAKQENERIIEQRAQIIAIKNKIQGAENLNIFDKYLLNKIAQQYKFYSVVNWDLERINSLLSRVDLIPVSLLLAQAANESGWGTSRFAKEGNNLFGMRCYSPGCGIIPLAREKGQIYEVAKYPSKNMAIRSYISNLNTHEAYENLRKIRERIRKVNKGINGRELVSGLKAYSIRGKDYVHSILELIENYKLENYD